MNFVDKVTIKVRAGKGGDGHKSFRHERYVNKGGPDGGDGGHGGSVIFQASNNQDTLASFRYSRSISAEDGVNGGKSRKTGRSGQDIVVMVPVGTAVYNLTGDLLQDLIKVDQQAVIAKGGKGGFGNAHFISSVRQAPDFAEKGEPGEEHELTLELKIIADVGLIGFPNAGKSTLLAKLSNARPEIADYPFTTLIPNLGVVDITPRKSLLLADIPGLIEGASLGKGLGIEFLKHIQRTRLLVHMIDFYNEDLLKSYKIIRKELKAYSLKLSELPEIVLINKTEGVNLKELNVKLAKLGKYLGSNTEIISISALSGLNLDQFKKLLLKEYPAIKKINKEKSPELKKVFSLKEDGKAFTVTKLSSKQYLVQGIDIERFAVRTDFSNQQGIQRLLNIMRKRGILQDLIRKGLKDKDQILFKADGSIKLVY